MKIGFVGLGTMGLPMAANLLKAGHSLRVWSRAPQAGSVLAKQGAQVVDSPTAVATGVEVLISMLSDDAAVRAVMLEGGALAALDAGAIHINMATVSAAFAREMAQRHQARSVSYIAAPVLGRVNVAEAGQLNILTAGAPEALSRVAELFEVLGQKTWNFGVEPELANVVKLALNFMLVSAIETMGEAAALVVGHGIDSAAVLELASSTLFAGPVYQGYGEAIGLQRFEPAGFKLELGGKDVRLALEAAQAAQVPMPFASVLRDNLLDSLAHGEGQLDLSALARVAARRAGQA